jgi:nicotinamide-nucleotide amidase
MVSAGLLITGNEVLSAKTKDTNGPFLGRELGKLGISIVASLVCGDDKEKLLSCFQYLSKYCDFIVVTGGLGPTGDDLTAQVVAEFFGKPLLFHEEAWKACVDYFQKQDRNSIPESNKKQAYLPESCTLLENHLGTASGFFVSGMQNEKEIVVYCLPGVPYEMEEMFLQTVRPRLVTSSFLPVVTTWQIFLLGESFLQSALFDAETKMLERFPTAFIAYQAHPYFVSYRVTFIPKTKTQKKEYEDYLENIFALSLEKSVGNYVLYQKDQKITEYLKLKCLEQHLTLSSVESLSGGVLAKELNSFCQNAEFLVCPGSLVVNTPKMREELLKNVPSFSLEGEESCPSQEAAQLACAARELMHSSVALSQCAVCQHDKEWMCLGLVIEKKYFSASVLAEAEEKLLKYFSWKKHTPKIPREDVVVYGCTLKKKQGKDGIHHLWGTMYLLCSLSSFFCSPEQKKITM